MRIGCAGQFIGVGGGGAPTARDYVQDGLINMWDGIENTGWGDHDATSRKWIDLISGHTISLGGNATFTDRSMCVDGVGIEGSPNYANFDEENSCTTLEFCFKMDNIISGFIDVGNTYSGCGIGKNEYGMFRSSYINIANVPCASVEIGEVITLSLINDGSLSRVPVAMYKNGSDDGVVFINCDVWSAGGRFVISGSDCFSYRNSKGCAYSIRLYNRALTQSEVSANYAIDRIRFNLP